MNAVEPTTVAPGPTLNEAQQRAVDAVSSSSAFAPFLLDGVTGSGKTEVYLELIRRTIDSGKQALVLVPEIGLTPQLIERFKARLGFEPALLHSGLTDLERLGAWRQARAGWASLVVGTRSAVFTPLPDIGLVIVDEEHDASFKQQEGLRYSARDLAIARAKRAGCPIVLGSATPTLELLRHSREGSYSRLSLPERAGGARPPRLRIVDTSRDYSEDGLGNALSEAIRQHLETGGQALLYLNRRGFAPTLVCPACNTIAECRRCDSRMTVHATDRQLRCHHCGSSRPLDTQCSECGADVRLLGAGTQRLEDAIRARFPGKRVTRIDSDTTQKKGEMHAALEDALLGKADILIGTQMLSKGHHFPKLTLVGVVNADQGLFGTDFRSDERMAQSIIQVAGRAGREETLGEVLIQTAFPEHPFWSRLVESGYPGIASDALAERERANWPPYSRLALIRAAAHKHKDAHAFLEAARRMMAHATGEAPGLRVLGPVDAVMARRAGRYRVQLLLVANERRQLHGLLRRLRPELEDSPLARKVRWSIDVDPIELY
jgi:primosomal protein N' (replication factor Y)